MQTTIPDTHVRSRQGRLAVLILHFGFLLSGIATALPGALVPLFTRQWLLSDVYAGSLVALQLSCSALGAVMVARQREKTVKVGYALAAAGFLLLGLDHRMLLFGAFAAIGGGIGLAMTSTSLFISEVYTSSRGGALSLLNFCWGIGAMLAPALVRILSIRGLLSMLFLTLAVLFALSCLIAMRLLSRPQPVSIVHSSPSGDTSLRVYFAAMLFLYVGVESSIGSWVTEFAERSSHGHHAWLAPYVASFFWGALLLGRALAPLVLLSMKEFSLHLSASVAAVAALVSLLVAGSYTGVTAAAVFAGLALAPIFPLDISALVGYSHQRSRLGWVFALAGFGGAVFTWLGGQLSTSLHSLRSSFIIAAAGALAMLVMTALYPAVWRTRRR